MKSEIIKRIESNKIVAIIRSKEQSSIERLLNILISSGIQVLEITSNTPGYTEEISKARSKHKDILIGAGTITDPILAEEAIESGAQFLVTPNTNTEVIDVAHRADIPVMMGALTPTDVANAINHKADMIKLFPAGVMGLDYFKALKGPFDSTKFFAVGGIGTENIREWIDAGIDGVGIGGSLLNQSEDEMNQSVQIFLDAVNH